MDTDVVDQSHIKITFTKVLSPRWTNKAYLVKKHSVDVLLVPTWNQVTF